MTEVTTGFAKSHASERRAGLHACAFAIEPSRRGSSRSALCPRQEDAPTANRSSNTQSLSGQTILYRIPLAANARRFRAELASQLAQAHAALFRWSDAVNVLENTLTALRDPRRTGAGRRGSSRRCRGRA